MELIMLFILFGVMILAAPKLDRVEHYKASLSLGLICAVGVPVLVYIISCIGAAQF